MQESEVDYDAIMGFYAAILKKDREAFELNKIKKSNDVEIWTRAVKEEEKIAMDKYCSENGQKEIEQIQKAIADRHARELQTKVNLKTANSAYEAYMEKMMEERNEKLNEARRAFKNKLGIELRDLIVKNAENLYKKNLIKIQNAEAEEKRRRQYLEKVEKEKAAGTYKDPKEGDDTEMSWGRGTKIHEAKQAQNEYEARMQQRQ